MVQRDLADTAWGSADVLPRSTALGVAVHCLCAWEKPPIPAGWAFMWMLMCLHRCAAVTCPSPAQGLGAVSPCLQHPHVVHLVPRTFGQSEGSSGATDLFYLKSMSHKH